MNPTTTETALDWARRYLAMGLHPLPMRTRTKRPPLVSWKAYQTTAPTDAEIEQWFMTSEPRNIALVLGRGVFAVDLDGPGAEALLQAKGIEIPDFAPRSRTSNGFHVLLEAPGPVPDRVALLADPATKSQVDIRGVGYIVAPPSIHPSGHAYAWTVQPGERDDLPMAPQALLDLILAPQAGPPLPNVGPDSPKWLTGALAGAPEGQRDQTCARLVGYFLGKHLPMDVIRATMINWAARCSPPFPDSQVDKTIQSMSARDAVHGRRRAPGQEIDITVPPRSPEAQRAPAGGIQQPFQALGYNQGLYFYLPVGARQVVELRPRDHNQLNLMALAPLQYWERAYPGDQGPKWHLAANALMRQCERVGVYDTARIRGRGAWWDEPASVLHLGDRLVQSGRTTPIQDVPPGRYVYESAAALDIAEPAEPLGPDDATRLIDLLERITWEQPINPQLLAGWCAVAPICGALTWRPHIWVTGAAGSGKTWVIDQIIRPIIGQIGLPVQSETTEAGLRQTLGNDARPVIFDEIEGEDQRAQTRIQNILALARQSSSETGAAIIKGSTNGAAVTFRIRSCFAFSSIGVGVQQHADTTRVTVLTINRDSREDAPQRFQALTAARADLLDEEYIRRFRARIIHMIPVIRANAAVFAHAGAAELGSQRGGDQLGALLAGCYALYDDAPITLADARAWLAKQDWTEHRTSQDSTDEQRCLQRILEHVIQLKAGSRTFERSIGELLAVALERATDDFTPMDAEAAINRYGVRTADHGFVVANSHSGIERILSGTPWARGWARLLRRLPGAEATDIPLRFAGVQCRGVSLMWSDEKTDTEFPYGANNPYRTGNCTGERTA